MPNRREFVSLAAFAGAAVLLNAQTQTPVAQNRSSAKTAGA